MKKFFSKIIIISALLQMSFAVKASEVVKFIQGQQSFDSTLNKELSKVAQLYSHVCELETDIDAYTPENSVKISSAFPDEIDACVDYYKKTNKFSKSINTKLRISCEGKSEARIKCLKAYERSLQKIGCDARKVYCVRNKCAYSSENCSEAGTDKKCLQSSNPRHLDESKKSIICVMTADELKKTKDSDGKYN